jgi:hypothetical protein
LAEEKQAEQRDAGSQPSGVADKNSQPEGSIPLTAILALIKPTIEGGTQIKQLLQHPESLSVRISDSVEQPGSHRVSFDIKNETEQGIYLESFQPEKPAGYEMQILEVVEDSDGSTDDQSLAPFKPRFLCPDCVVKFKAIVPLQGWSWLNVAPYGVVSLTYSKLDEEKPAPRKSPSG